MPEEVDFTDQSTALYRLYDGDGVLLYVGITGQLPVRMEQHESCKSWWPDVARKTVMLYDSWDEADAAETVAVVEESPKYNEAKQPPASRAIIKLVRKVPLIATEAARRGWTFEWSDPWPRGLSDLLAEILHVREYRSRAWTGNQAIPLPACSFCEGTGGGSPMVPEERRLEDPCRPCLSTGFDLVQLSQGAS